MGIAQLGITGSGIDPILSDPVSVAIVRLSLNATYAVSQKKQVCIDCYKKELSARPVKKEESPANYHEKIKSHFFDFLDFDRNVTEIEEVRFPFFINNPFTCCK
uniref:Uncharacterized protein n=1 Tax=Romanomermis culicivorax TaxID=13658 RepID=A0A915KHU4_ROMCU